MIESFYNLYRYEYETQRRLKINMCSHNHRICTILTGVTAPPITILLTLQLISSQGSEYACKQPVAIMTVIFMVVMIFIKCIAMFAFFTELDS
jgi:hypothetical protein